MARTAWVLLCLLLVLGVWLATRDRAVPAAPPTSPSLAELGPPGSEPLSVTSTSPSDARSSVVTARVLEGRVTFPEGSQPEEGATIMGSAGVRAPVGRDGRFQIRIPPESTGIWLRLVSERYVLTGSQLVSFDPIPDELHLVAELGAHIEGRVVLPANGVDASTVVGRRIEIHSSSAVDMHVHGERIPGTKVVAELAATVAEDLSFASGPVPAHTTARLELVVPEVGEALAEAADLEAGETRHVDLGLRRSGGVRGRVVGMRDEPVGDAQVLVTFQRVAVGVEAELARTATDGGFTFDDVGLRGVTLYVVDERYFPVRTFLGDLQAGEVRTDILLRVQGPATIECLVLDEGGEPSGANLHVWPWKRRPDARGLLRELPQALRLRGEMEEAQVLLGESPRRESSNGVQLVTGLDPGRTIAFARRGLDRAGLSNVLSLEEGSTTKIELQLGPATLLYVFVEGEPQPNRPTAKIEIREARDFDLAPVLEVEDFRARARPAAGLRGAPFGPLPPGEYRVRATRADGASAEAIAQVTGSAPCQVSLRFPEPAR